MVPGELNPTEATDISKNGTVKEGDREKAASAIQRTYRGHRTRRQLNGFGLDASTRWYEAVRDAQYHHVTDPLAAIPQPASDGTLDGDRKQAPGAKKQWLRATHIAKRAGQDDSSPSVSELSDDGDDLRKAESPSMTPEELRERKERRRRAIEARKKSAKMMDLQYFLEMVDHKHRYGSNLRKYHAHWQQQDTSQNFFYWLDHGEGLQVDLPECSRARLDQEQVRYLSREERMHYLVQVDKDGRLRWAKNGELVWTKDELYKDSVMGIVPTSDPTPQFQHNVAPQPSTSEELSSDSESESEEDEDEDEGENEEEKEKVEGDEGERYINEDFHRARGVKKLKHVSAGVLFNHMVRKSLKKGHKWIFVADTSFRLYVGYKQSGSFQHSSFLHGSRITAAGIIKIKHGSLRKLSPLSGHYRPPAKNFRAFVQSLKEEGVDMSRVSISRSYAVLVGMESYLRTKKKVDKAHKAVGHEADKLLKPDKVKAAEEAARDKSQSAEKERQYLEQQRREHKNQGSGRGIDRGLVSRLTKHFSRLSGGEAQEEEDAPARPGRRVGGTGPEDGVPPPEGTR